MKVIPLLSMPRTYKNNGQHAEQKACYTLTGEIVKASNTPFWCGGDIGDLQVKSAKATVCHGTDINEHLDRDGAKMWGYVTADFSTMYVMDRAEWTEFVKLFGYVTRESSKNGGAIKIRLREESKAMRAWLIENLN